MTSSSDNGGSGVHYNGGAEASIGSVQSGQLELNSYCFLSETTHQIVQVEDTNINYPEWYQQGQNTLDYYDPRRARILNLTDMTESQSWDSDFPWDSVP